MANKSLGEEWLPLVCLKTQIALVRNLRSAVFPARMAQGPARRFGRHLAEAMSRAVRTLGTWTVEDVTDDIPLAEAGEIYYGLTPGDGRGPGYRLLRLGEPATGREVWCELMSANHLTFSVTGHFASFEAEEAALHALVDALGAHLDYAADKDLGYLTAQVSLLGTGLRIRSWMHVGGLTHFGYLQELSNAAMAKEMLVELDNPDSPPPGSIVIVFNRFSLGMPAQEIVRRFGAFLRRVSAQEAAARKRLFHDEPFVFLNLLKRAKAVLKNAMMMDEMEALDLLSDVRLGLTTGAIAARKIDPLTPHWFDDATDRVFYAKHGRALRRKARLPHDVDTFPPWRDEALRAEWMRPLASFSFSNELIERADEQ